MPEHIKHSLTQLIKNLKAKSKDKKEISSVLREVFNEKIQYHIQGYRTYKKNLIIYVDSSLWSFDVHLLKPKLLEKLHQIKSEIRTIKIKIQAK